MPLHQYLERALDSSASPRAVETFLEALRLRAQSVQVDDRFHPELPIPGKPMRTGSEWTAEELDQFRVAIAGSHALPNPARGWEALVDFGPIDPAWIEGWTGVVFSVDDGGFASSSSRISEWQRCSFKKVLFEEGIP